MGEVMTQAIIGMPYEIAMSDELSRRQFHDRAQYLLGEHEKLQDENAKLRAELERLPVDGWKLVPVEATREMCLAATQERREYPIPSDRESPVVLWRAMLAAAPSVPATVPDAITMTDVMRAWEYAEDHPHKYLRGTTNWCAAMAHSLNQQRVADPSAPKADPVKVQLLEALEAIAEFIPKTSASEGGAAKNSANVRAADKVRAAIAAARKGEGE